MITPIANLRNRIEASKKAATYSERTHVDAPVHELEAMLKERDDLLDVLRTIERSGAWCGDERPYYSKEQLGRMAGDAVAKATT